MHYPLPFLEPMLMSMRTQEREQKLHFDEHWERELRDAIDQTPIELRLEIGRCPLPVKNFLHMKPGDLLPLTLSEEDPATLWVEQYPLFLASPGQQQGMLAAEILEPIHIGGNT